MLKYFINTPVLEGQNSNFILTNFVLFTKLRLGKAVLCEALLHCKSCEGGIDAAL